MAGDSAAASSGVSVAAISSSCLPMNASGRSVPDATAAASASAIFGPTACWYELEICAVGAAAVDSSGADAASRRAAPETMPGGTASKVAGGARAMLLSNSFSASALSAPTVGISALPSELAAAASSPRDRPRGRGAAQRADLLSFWGENAAVPWLQPSSRSHSTESATRSRRQRRWTSPCGACRRALSAGSGSAAFAYSSAAAAPRWCSRPSCSCMRSMLSRRRSKLRVFGRISAAPNHPETPCGRRWRCTCAAQSALRI